MVSTRSSSVRGDSLGPEFLSPATPAPATTTTSASSSTGTVGRSSKRGAATSSRTSRAASAKGNGFQHAPTTATLLWMAVSLPLVAWDTVYVLGRPHTMEGGWLHWPLWVPYKLYGTVDHVYGWKAFNAREGFTGAQGFLNLVESALYCLYLWLYFAKGLSGAGATVGARKVVSGKAGAWAVLIGFTAAVMTLSKTALYWLVELFGEFSNIGHNNAVDLLFLWIIPNGAWLVGSGYMMWSLGNDILDGLNGQSSHAKSE